MLELLWLIPLLPLASAALNGLLGRRPPKALVTALGLGGPFLSLVLALLCLLELDGRFEQSLYAWTAGPLKIDVGFLLDPLSAVMLFVVTFVGFLIHVYSAGYMGHDPGYRRYFAYLNLFMWAMLTLILGNNYLVMFVGWEGVGLCSYLLIGFYFEEAIPPAAGKKAFIVNRIGDFAFLVGLFALIANFGTLDYSVLGRIAADPSLVTGEYWAGEKSVSLGLADKIGDIRSTLRERFGEKVLTPVIAPASGMLSGLLGRRSPGAGALAAFDGVAGLPDDLISALETRAIWAKFGF